MARTYTAPSIEDYLLKRLMPVEGTIPHLEGIEMYGNSIPAGTVGGDLFEYINFQQRYDIDARIQRALKQSKQYLEPLPAGAIPRNSVDDHVQWLKSRPGYKPEMESAYREARSSEQVRVAEDLRELYSTAGTRRDTESLQRKSRRRSTTRFMPSCSPNSIIEGKRRRSYSRG